MQPRARSQSLDGQAAGACRNRSCKHAVREKSEKLPLPPAKTGLVRNSSFTAYYLGELVRARDAFSGACLRGPCPAPGRNHNLDGPRKYLTHRALVTGLRVLPIRCCPGLRGAARIGVRGLPCLTESIRDECPWPC